MGPAFHPGGAIVPTTWDYCITMGHFVCARCVSYFLCNQSNKVVYIAIFYSILFRLGLQPGCNDTVECYYELVTMASTKQIYKCQHD